VSVCKLCRVCFANFNISGRNFFLIYFATLQFSSHTNQKTLDRPAWGDTAMGAAGTAGTSNARSECIHEWSSVCVCKQDSERPAEGGSGMVVRATMALSGFG
jgi:hypothetical protein